MSHHDNKGTSLSQKIDLAGKTGHMAKLSFQLTSLDANRDKLMQQLGTEVYEEVRALPELAQKHDAILSAIASLDAQRTDVQQQIDSLKVMMREIASTTPVDSTLGDDADISGEYYTCPRCGTAVAATEKFCTGCGLPIEEVRNPSLGQGGAISAVDGSRSVAAPMPVCPQCGAPVREGDRFCMSCGCDLSNS